MTPLRRFTFKLRKSHVKLNTDRTQLHYFYNIYSDDSGENFDIYNFNKDGKGFPRYEHNSHDNRFRVFMSN